MKMFCDVFTNILHWIKICTYRRKGKKEVLVLANPVLLLKSAAHSSLKSNTQSFCRARLKDIAMAYEHYSTTPARQMSVHGLYVLWNHSYSFWQPHHSEV